MELESETANQLKADTPNGAAMEIESDATLGYASIQNSVPVIRSLRLTNHGADALVGLEVLIACNPGFAQGTKLRFDRLAPGETRSNQTTPIWRTFRRLSTPPSPSRFSLAPPKLPSNPKTFKFWRMTSGQAPGHCQSCWRYSACPTTQPSMSSLARHQSCCAHSTTNCRWTATSQKAEKSSGNRSWPSTARFPRKTFNTLSLPPHLEQTGKRFALLTAFLKVGLQLALT